MTYYFNIWYLAFLKNNCYDQKVFSFQFFSPLSESQYFYSITGICTHACTLFTAKILQVEAETTCRVRKFFSIIITSLLAYNLLLENTSDKVLDKLKGCDRTPKNEMDIVLLWLIRRESVIQPLLILILTGYDKNFASKTSCQQSFGK